MPKLLDHLRHIFHAPGFPKPSTALNIASANQGVSKTNNLGKDMPWEPTSMRLPGHALDSIVGAQYLQHILSQVKHEGFHVESLTIFRYGNLKPSESIVAIEQWAAAYGLKVSINHAHDICFFEKV